jgi:hypothetical protein
LRRLVAEDIVAMGDDRLNALIQRTLHAGAINLQYEADQGGYDYGIKAANIAVSSPSA